MAELEVDLQLTIRDALEAIDDMGKALADMMEDFQDDISKAFKSLEEDFELSIDTRDAERNIEQLLELVQPIELQVSADTDEASISLDELRAKQIEELLEVTVTADTDAFTDLVDAAKIAAESPIDIIIDTSIENALAEIDRIRNEASEEITLELTVDADTTGLQEAEDDAQKASEALEEVETQSGKAGEKLTGVADTSQIAGTAMALATGQGKQFAEKLASITNVSVGTIGGVIAVAGAMALMFHSAESARAASDRLNLVFGDMTAEVLKMNIGGLSGDLSEIATSAGQSGAKLKDAAASAGQMAKQAGKSDEMVIFAQRINAISIRAAVLKPSLGEAGAIAETLQRRLGMGGPALEKYGISLTRNQINTEALKNSQKDLVQELTQYEKAAAGAELATRILGDKLGKDVVEGSKQSAIQIKVLRAEMNSALAGAGEALIDPITDMFRTLLPVVTTAARVIGVVLYGAFKIIAVPIKIVDGLINGFLSTLGLTGKSFDLVSKLIGVFVGFLVLYKTAQIAATVATFAQIAATKTFGIVQGLATIGMAAWGAAISITTVIWQAFSVSFVVGMRAILASIPVLGWALLALSVIVGTIVAAFSMGGSEAAKLSEEAIKLGEAFMKAGKDMESAAVDKALKEQFKDLTSIMAKTGTTISETSDSIVLLTKNSKNMTKEEKNLVAGMTAVRLAAVMGEEDLTSLVKAQGLANTEFGKSIIAMDGSAGGAERYTAKIFESSRAIKEATQSTKDANTVSDERVRQREREAQAEKQLTKVMDDLAKSIKISVPEVSDQFGKFSEAVEAFTGSSTSNINDFATYLKDDLAKSKGYIEGIQTVASAGFPAIARVIVSAGQEAGTAWKAQFDGMDEATRTSLENSLLAVEQTRVDLMVQSVVLSKDLAKKFKEAYNAAITTGPPLTDAEAEAFVGGVPIANSGATVSKNFKKQLRISESLNEEMDRVIKDFDVKRSELSTKVSQAASEVGVKFGTMLTTAIGGMKGVVSLGGSGLAQAAVNGAKDGIKDIREAGRSGAKAFAEAMDNHRSAVRDAGLGLANAARDGAATFTGNGVGWNAAMGMRDGLLAGRSEVQAAGEALGKSAKKGVQIGLRLASPSLVMRKLGQQSGEGFALGLGDMNQKVSQAAEALARSAIVPTAYEVSASLAPNKMTTQAGGTQSQNAGAPVIGSMTVIGQDPVSTAAAVGRELAFQRRFQGGT